MMTANSVYMTGGNAYTETSWSKLMERVDDNLEAVKKEQRTRFAKRDEHREKEELLKRAALVKEQNQMVQDGNSMKRMMTDRNSCSADVPYYYLAEDGVIIYEGVTFVCDERNHAICLGDMTNPDEVITIPLSEGGSLKVNRNNIDELSKAITMFSPEDIKRILQAIALDAKVQQMKNEIEDDKNSLGESADATVAAVSGTVEGFEGTGILSVGKIDDIPSKEQIALLFTDRNKEEEG